jgi:hypothetical protein
VDIVAIGQAFMPKRIKLLPDAENLRPCSSVYYLYGFFQFKASQAFGMYLVYLQRFTCKARLEGEGLAL